VKAARRWDGTARARVVSGTHTVGGAGLARLGDWLVGPDDGPIDPSPKVIPRVMDS
jgi:hypothetical protein